MTREEAARWLINLSYSVAKSEYEGEVWAKWALEAFDMAIAALREKQQRQPDTERVDVAPGFDSIRPSATGVADKREGVAHD